MISRRKSWKDDLVPLFVATLAQFGILRFIDWAKANVDTQPIAQTAAQYRFFFAPQLVAVAIVYLLYRALRSFLADQGVQPGEWLKASILTLLLGLTVVLFAHLDQLVDLLSRLLKLRGLADAAEQLHKSAFYGLLARISMLRFVVDLAGAGIVFGGARLTKPKHPDLVAARAALKAKEFGKAGELFLRVGRVEDAKRAFITAKLPVRVAALELRAGNHSGAAALYEQAGEAFAWEAARAWDAAGDPGRARAAGERALAEARAGSRWDRVAEVAEALGDAPALADACRRLAEAAPAGPGRVAVWKRAAETARAAGRLVDAAEAYRVCGETLRAAELFLEGGRPLEALRDFEKVGELARAAAAAAAAGQEKVAAELSARDLEARGDHLGAAAAWVRAEKWERAAPLFERRGAYDRAADAWREAGKPDRAAPHYQKVGDLAAAAACFEAAALPDKAAALYRDLGQLDKAAALFRTAGRWQDAAQALQQQGQFDDAVSLFIRAGKGVDAARTALLAGHRERAWDLVSGVRRSDPAVAELFLELAEAHLVHGESKDAIHVLRELLGHGPVEPRNVAAHEALARAFDASGDVAEAADRMAMVAAYDPDFRDAARRAARLEGARAKLPPPVIEEAPASINPAVIQTRFRTGGQPSVPLAPLPPRLTTGMFPPPASAATGSGAFSSLPESPERRYDIVSELGRGGMGIVHKAHDTKLERWVALKILPAQLWGDETAMRYFAREAKAIAALSHPNVVALYDFGEGFGSAYLAMEYLEGPNLQTLLKSDADKVRRCWRDWFVQAARGIAAAHAKGILHRDLKPANLVLDTNGTLRILDFGLARPEADSGATSKLIGTPAFFPPEVLRGEPATAASDVYSLGATFYTLATGRWPYVGDDVLVARLERDPDDPRPFAPFLSEDEVWVLLKSLARHRPERYQDGGELLQALLSLEA